MSNVIILATALRLTKVVRTLNLDPMGDTSQQLELLTCVRNQIDLLQINNDLSLNTNHGDHINYLFAFTYEISKAISDNCSAYSSFSGLIEYLNDLLTAEKE